MPLPDKSVIEAAEQADEGSLAPDPAQAARGELEDLREALARERTRYRALEQRVADRAGELRDATEAKDALIAREQRARDDAVDLLAQLFDERARLQAVVHQMPAGVVIAEAPSGKVVVANASAEKLMGPAIGAEGPAAHEGYTGFRPDGREYDPDEWPLARSIRTGEPVAAEEISVVRRDGSLVTISLSATPIRARSGTVIAAVAIFHDITERKRAEERDRFLAEAGELLFSSLDANAILGTLAELAVPRLADLCTIAVRREDGTGVEDISIAAGSNRAIARPGASDPAGVPAPFRTAESELHPRVNDELLRSIARDPAHLETLRALDAKSYMCVPLVARTGVLAAISFFTAESGRRYTEDDIALAEDLARRAALAVENARLYTKLESERDRLRRLLEGLHQGVVTVSRDLRIQFANSEARHALGVEDLGEGDLLPEPWEELPLRSFTVSLFDSAKAVERRVTDGEKTHAVLGVPGQDADTVVLVFTDVSEREALERAEREFVTNAAHELRTPLAAMTTSIEVLQAGAKEHPDERDLFLAHIERECARLRRLAHALLVLARAQTGQESLQRGPVDVRSVLEDVRAGLATAAGVEIDVRCAADLTVAADRDLLEQAMWNLGVNAVKHTNGGRVLLAAHPAPGGGVEIEVRDSGPGIPFVEQRRVFERFYRTGERDAEGFGLGLAIVQQAVQALGGGVDISSAPGGGTSVRVKLPGPSEAS
jgi:signal transduction histidine kinase